jgi:hypothetical protein
MGLLVLLVLCLLLSVISALSNRNLPQEDTSPQLSAVDKTRILETLHLKATLGDQVWQGWGSANIPVIVWNRGYEFLVDYEEGIPSGWSKIDEDLNGLPFFRRFADEPQNFAVQVDNVWTASMATKTTTDVFLIQTFRDMFPPPFKQVFPYRLMIQPSETQIGQLLHETFHAYQYQTAPERIAAAESIHKLGEQYETESERFQSELEKESHLLAAALQAKTANQKIELVRQFLTIRDARRKDNQLSPDLIHYEQWIEWEEGTAKYIELAILKQANAASDYVPVAGMINDTSFEEYQKFKKRWSDELFQLRYQATGETRFYMTGLAQAFLLDDLLPDWHAEYWSDGVFLENLLRSAIEGD